MDGSALSSNCWLVALHHRIAALEMTAEDGHVVIALSEERCRLLMSGTDFFIC